MSIRVTKNQPQPVFNPIGWTATGAVAGYIAKDLIPLSKAEKDHYEFDQFVIDRKSVVKNAVEDELNAVRNVVKNGTEDKGYQTYLDFVKNAKPKEVRDKFLQDVVEKLPANAKATFSSLRAKVDGVVKDVKRTQNFIFETAVKKSRSNTKYMLTGALLTTGIGYVKYAMAKMSAPKS